MGENFYLSLALEEKRYFSLPRKWTAVHFLESTKAPAALLFFPAAQGRRGSKAPVWFRKGTKALRGVAEAEPPRRFPRTRSPGSGGKAETGGRSILPFGKPAPAYRGGAR